MNGHIHSLTKAQDVRSCLNCRVGHLCMGGNCPRSVLSLIDQQIKHQTVAKKNAVVIDQNSPFTNCYIVKAGAVKTVFLNERGDEKIMGFHLPGEAFGLEGILEGRNSCSAIALERSTLCKLNYKKLQDFSDKVPSLHEWLLRSVLRELHSLEVLTRWLSYSTAEERIVSFLLDLSDRQKLRSWHMGEFRLPMCRQDIANYLGLALETVSRVLHRLQRNGDLRVRNRQIELLKFDVMRERIAVGARAAVRHRPNVSRQNSDFLPTLARTAAATQGSELTNLFAIASQQEGMSPRLKKIP